MVEAPKQRLHALISKTKVNNLSLYFPGSTQSFSQVPTKKLQKNQSTPSTEPPQKLQLKYFTVSHILMRVKDIQKRDAKYLNFFK